MKKGKSRIGNFFSRMSGWIYRMIALCFIGRLFTSYERCDSALHTAYAFGGGRGRVQRKRHYPVRRALACAMEQNIVTRAINTALHALLFTSLRTFGFFFTMVGTGFIFLYGVEIFSAISGLVTWSHLIAGLILLPVGVLLLLTDRSLGAALYKGSLVGLILFRLLGLSDEPAGEAPKRGVAHYLAALLFSLFTVALGLLISPLSLLAVVLALLTVLTVLSVPEAGFLLTLLVLPFSRLLVGSHLLTVCFVICTLVGYVGKILRGNRVFRLDWQDFPLLLIAVLLFVGGFTVTGDASWREVLLKVLFVVFYLVAVNILATPHWLVRCRTALILGGTAAASYGMARLFYTVIVTEGLSLSRMMLYGSVMRVGFADARAFALYLVIALAFLLPTVAQMRGWRRLFALVATLLVGIGAVLTGMTGAWFSMLAVLVVFLLVYEHRSLFAVIFGGGALTGTLFLLPAVARNAVFGVFRDVNLPVRAQGRGTVKALLLGGGGGFFGKRTAVIRLLFGMGEGALPALYPYVGSIAAPFAYEAYYFWQVMLVEYGIFGILLPALFLFILLQNSFTVLAHAPRGKHLAYVGVSLVAALLVFSFFGYVFYDTAALLALLSAISLIAADLRYARKRLVPETESPTDATCSHLEYRASAKRVSSDAEGGAL